MGCTCYNYYVCNKEVYENFKKTFKKLKIIRPQNLEDIYLLSTNSIPKFVQFIKQPVVLTNLHSDNNGDDSEFRNYLSNDIDYELFQNIKSYDSYQPCKDIAERNEDDENEFIIVEKDFIESIISNNDMLINRKVKLNINENEMKIQFLSNFLKIEKKKPYSYQFIRTKEHNIRMDNLNSRTTVNNQVL